MITTADAVLKQVSYILNESIEDVSIKRISFFNRAFKHFSKQFKWAFRRLKGTLTVSAGVQEYDLTSAFTDYDPISGIYEVYIGGERIDPVDYGNISKSGANAFALTPDNKSIKFRDEIVGDELIEIWYYAIPTDVASESTTLNISIPEACLTAIVTYIKHLIHDSKRQRYDARNAILDFQEQVSKLKLSESSNKGRGLPKTVPTIMQYTGYRRSYKN